MRTDTIGLGVVVTFAAWCLYSALTTGKWDDYMIPATIAVLIGGRFAFAIGREAD